MQYIKWGPALKIVDQWSGLGPIWLGVFPHHYIKSKRGPIVEANGDNACS